MAIAEKLLPNSYYTPDLNGAQADQVTPPLLGPSPPAPPPFPVAGAEGSVGGEAATPPGTLGSVWD